jgi:arylsulfatase A-like enzyme
VILSVRVLASLVAAGALALGCHRGTPDPGAPSSPPSIVLVSLDTTRADRLGTYGHRGAATPTIDALAAEGVVFEEVVTPVPLTLPAHATLLTGWMPWRHGVRNNGLYKLGVEPPTLPELLAKA